MGSILDNVVTGLIESLAGLLRDEAKFLAGVDDTVNSLIGELRFINIFLKNSEGKRNDEIVREVVRQIKVVANDAEDVIDTFILKVAEHRSKSMIGRIARYPSHARMLRNVGSKIVEINKRIEGIYNNKERYGIERHEATVNAFEEEAMHRLRREVEEDDVVGFVHDSTTLVNQLTEGDPELDVISIIGMGGLGKTTLAKKIYNNLHVVGHFTCRVWVCVSQDFKTMELLLKILKELGITPTGKSVEELKKELFEYLNGKRYLIVMDDIWRTEVWDEVKSAFPNNSNGSKILITSRNREVALHASNTSPYFLPLLNEDDSWELFRKKVFRKAICPPELETPGKQIAKGCRGLPLSIVVFAGLLSKKEKSLRTWSTFVDHVTSFLTHEEDTAICLKILSLSYSDLRRCLKPCFLYFGMYPEDLEIPVRPLIHLWVAESFIQHIDRRSPEDVAESYLEELIDRSLIQVARRRSDGGVRTCRIHDLLREFCIKESAEEMFFAVHSYNRSIPNNCRRLSIQVNNAKQYITANPSIPTSARSLFFFADDEWNQEKDAVSLKWVQENFKFLRVLNVQKVATTKFRGSIAKFIHLRYLTIRFSSDTTVFPDSIVKLTNLETLYVESYGFKKYCLLKWIFKLKRLRNLYLRGLFSFEPCDSEEALGSLQILSGPTICCDPQNRPFPAILENFPNVRKLKILIVDPGEKRPVEYREVDSIPGLHRLAHLEILKISSSPCSLLRFTCSPNSIPARITKLTLIGVVLKVECVTVLGQLPSLRILKLEDADRYLCDKSIHVIANSFPQLQFLKLRGLSIEKWELGGGAMPSLKHLVFLECFYLTSLPELLELTSLRSVEMIRCLNLATMLRKSQMEVRFNLLIKDY